LGKVQRFGSASYSPLQNVLQNFRLLLVKGKGERELTVGFRVRRHSERT
jgi:hypothetical protein